MQNPTKMLICLLLTIECFPSAINAGLSPKCLPNDCEENDGGVQETRTLEQIYKAAMAEGGKLLLYAGGDVASQQTAVKSGFEAAFPNMTLDIVVDYSKFHDARIDWQLANGKLQPDVVTLQTIQDFPRWKAGGRLLQYKPANFSKIYREFRDEDGFYVGFMVFAFGYLSNANLLAANKFPRVATDYLKPIFKGGKLAVTYPNDDDAVLFWFKQTIDKYGWQWMDKFIDQEPIYVRGTNVPRDLMANNTAAASMTTVSNAKAYVGNGTSALRFTFPSDNDPFTVWAQTGAIFKSAKHPEAAKLFLNWMLMKETFLTMGQIWPVRVDNAPAQGFKQIWEYQNSSHRKFLDFMSNRTAVELFKTQMTLYVGEPQGPPTPGVYGMMTQPNV